mmetsp:Transcript_37801/g.100578  ORF Transcript_37801/g.100578 Transcript_37801/m.100578 type:complete len:235 (-) Transcript_37801:280-984(-)
MLAQLSTTDFEPANGLNVLPDGWRESRSGARGLRHDLWREGARPTGCRPSDLARLPRGLEGGRTNGETPAPGEGSVETDRLRDLFRTASSSATSFVEGGGDFDLATCTWRFLGISPLPPHDATMQCLVVSSSRSNADKSASSPSRDCFALASNLLTELLGATSEDRTLVRLEAAKLAESSWVCTACFTVPHAVSPADALCLRRSKLRSVLQLLLTATALATAFPSVSETVCLAM